MPTETKDTEETSETEETSTEETGNADGLKKALAAERKAAAEGRKAVKALEAKLKEFEDRDKTDGEKLADRVAKAEAEAAKATAEAAKLRVGMDKGLTLRQAMRLQGETEEELAADADDLLETFPGKSGEKSETDEAGKGDGERRPPSRRPTEDLSGGGDPTNPPEEMDPAKLAAFIPRP